MKSKLFAQYFKKKREEKGLTQKEVADKMQYITAQFISNFERSISQCPIGDIDSLSKIIGANKDEMSRAWFENKVTDYKNELINKFKNIGVKL